MIPLHDIFKQIKDATSLTHGERSLIRSRLETLVKTTPFSVAPIPSPFFRSFYNLRMYGATTVLLVVLSFGATSLIAKDSLPGDTLYALKTGVNERIEQATALSKEKKAQVGIEHMEERLREVELLAVLENTDTRTIEDITEDIEARVEKAYEKAYELAKMGDVEAADTISSNVASVLSAHRDILEAQGQSSVGGEYLLELSKVLDMQNREQTEETGDTIARIAHAREIRIAVVLKAFARALGEETLRDDVRTELMEEQAKIEALYSETAPLLAQEQYGKASEIYGHLEQRIHLARTLLTSVVRIAEKTNKEAVIQFGEVPANVATVAAKQVESESAPTSSALDAATMMLMSTPVEEVRVQSAPLENPALRFTIIDVVVEP